MQCVWLGSGDFSVEVIACAAGLLSFEPPVLALADVPASTLQQLPLMKKSRKRPADVPDATSAAPRVQGPTPAQAAKGASNSARSRKRQNKQISSSETVASDPTKGATSSNALPALLLPYTVYDPVLSSGDAGEVLGQAAKLSKKRCAPKS